MPLMLPSGPSQARTLTGVAGDLIGAVTGKPRSLKPVRSAVLIVIDGLGAIALRAHAGHARTLAAGFGRRDVAVSVFPTTTAAALTSLLTGTDPAEHGLLGYRILDPDQSTLVNLLSGWDQDGVSPEHFPNALPLFERHQPGFAVGPGEFAGSGFSRAILRGAHYVPEEEPEQRVRVAYELAARHAGAVVYCYLPEVDRAGHRSGVDSAEWLAALETVDRAVRVPIPRGVGVLITADHGMIDVPAHRHVLLDPDEPFRQNVRLIGGEPRMLHVYLEEPESAGRSVEHWQRRLEGLADVGTRQETIDAELFGPELLPRNVARIGDLVVVARGNRALYPAENEAGRTMIGQHGALTPEERHVPYLSWGDFAASA